MLYALFKCNKGKKKVKKFFKGEVKESLENSFKVYFKDDGSKHDFKIDKKKNMGR